MKRKYAQIAGSGLGFIHGNVPGAAFGYNAAGKAYDYLYPNPKRLLLTLPKKNTRMGYYKGAMLKRRPRITFKDVALTKGYHVSEERYGNVSDPHAVYINHSTAHYERIAVCVAGILIRTLYRKAGISVNSNKDEVYGTGVSNSSGFDLVFESRNRNSGVVTAILFTVPDNFGLQDIVNAWVGLIASLSGSLAGGADIPYRIALRTTGATGVGVATLDLQTTFMVLSMSSTLKFQNRTRGDTATDDQLDKVDNQPLIVKGIEHRHADPRLAFSHNSLGTYANNLDSTSREGLKLMRAAQFPDNEYQNMQSSKMWNNVYREGKIILNPGVMKTSKCYFTIKGYVSNVFIALKGESDNVNFSSGRGRCVTLMMEEKMRTAGSNPVTVGYERLYEVGGYCTFDKPSAITSKFGTVEQNNTVPA